MSTLKFTGENDRPSRRWVKRSVVMAVLAVPFAVIIVLAVLVTASKASLRPSDTSLATLRLPFGGAKVTRVVATVGREVKDLPVSLVGDQVLPRDKVATGQPVTIIVKVKRPGWNAWLAGSTQQLKLTVTTPVSALTSSYVTVKSGHDMTLHYTEPVASFAYAKTGAKLTAQSLSGPATSVSLKPGAAAGAMTVSAAPRVWELPATQTVSWFPAGTKATAVASPAPGTSLTPNSAITLTFSKPVKQALSDRLPTVSPAGSGSWSYLNAHTIRFDPSGYGYGLGAKVQVALPAGVNLVGGTGDPVGTWSVPTGSTTRLQQLLAQLGYLPLTYTGTGTPVASTVDAQEAAAVTAPAGSFSWRYGDTPAALKGQWQPGSYDELTTAAVMSFENNAGLTTDGIDGPSVWKALIQAALKDQTNPNGYTFVFVHEANSGETEMTWHDGKTVVSGPVNTGVAAAGGTETGVYAVFEHLPVTTMTGVNPDGSHYSDPGIPDVSYFHGGDALHGFIRASYGFPQSDGCVEMPFSEAAAVYPYTPVGTVVDVSTAS